MADLTYTSATALTYAQTIFGPDVTITGATLIGNAGQTQRQHAVVEFDIGAHGNIPSKLICREP